MQISQRDKRAILLTAIISSVILINHYLITPWLDEWEDITQQIKMDSKKVEHLSLDSTKALAAQAHLNKLVPSFKQPVDENTQRHLFQKAFSEHLKRSGIKAQRMNYLSSSEKQAGFKVLKLQSKFVCPISKFHQLLASINENPHLRGVDELTVSMDKNNRSNVDITLTLSTYAI